MFFSGTGKRQPLKATLPHTKFEPKIKSASTRFFKIPQSRDNLEQCLSRRTIDSIRQHFLRIHRLNLDGLKTELRIWYTKQKVQEDK